MDAERPQKPAQFESTPLTRSEYIAAMVHLYRGELGRSLIWRQRMDTTTNWAIFTTGAMLTFLFSEPAHHHVVALLGISLVFFMLCYEARRFRFFNVWRYRVRLIEENFYGPLLRRDLTSPVENWAFLVAEDLMTPRFRLGFLTALRARLLRNYIPIFLVLFGAWLTKLTLHPAALLLQVRTDLTPTQVVPISLALRYTDVGLIPSWAVNILVFGFAGFLILVALFARPRTSAESRWWSPHSDESVDEFS